jgi:hypothetical protein
LQVIATEPSFQLRVHPSRYVTLDLGYEPARAWAVLQALDWSSPLLTLSDDDVDGFDWHRQELVLSSSSSNRFRRALPVRGRGTLAHPPEHAFVVSLGDAMLYGGIFLAGISAMGIRFPVIYVVDRSELVALQIRPTHSAFAPYPELPIAARSTIELPALREHFARTHKLASLMP